MSTERIRGLEMTLSKEQKAQYAGLVVRVSEAYATKASPRGRITGEQKLYLLERILTGRSVHVPDVLRLHETKAVAATQ